MPETTEINTDKSAFDIEHLCSSFFELSPQPMIAVEGDTHIVRYVNNAFSKLCGTSRADLIGRRFSEVVPEGEAVGPDELVNRLITRWYLPAVHAHKYARFLIPPPPPKTIFRTNV